jgi:hypothetical protein
MDNPKYQELSYAGTNAADLTMKEWLYVRFVCPVPNPMKY